MELIVRMKFLLFFADVVGIAENIFLLQVNALYLLSSQKTLVRAPSSLYQMCGNSITVALESHSAPQSAKAAPSHPSSHFLQTDNPLINLAR